MIPKLRRTISQTADRSLVGFIGLGAMGSPMATNLAQKLAKHLNMEVAQSVHEITTRAKFVITMLPESTHVEQVYLDKHDGLLEAAQSGSLFIDCSTIDVSTSRNVAKFASELGRQINFLDAPVSGGVPGAEKGTLTFMVGGTEDGFRRAENILRCMGKNIVHCGPAGNGQVAKMANNLALAISMAGVCEAMNLGAKQGMDPRILAKVMNTSTARCWSSDTYNPVPGVMENVPASRDYENGFRTELLLKDIGLAMRAANDLNIKLLVGEHVASLYENMRKQGYAKKDFSGLYRYLYQGPSVTEVVASLKTKY
ncbi:3-hydroxyisobutyrate dehydrogenase, mitochondrial [Galdieria sulphuraria]|nr:3-hydroxyisobutyrate dehydrogenase, mitochondrial [Galdieria sulphuraria]